MLAQAPNAQQGYPDLLFMDNGIVNCEVKIQLLPL